MLVEIVDPTYLKQLVESVKQTTDALSHLSTTLQNLSRVGFDESSRIYVRVPLVDTVSSISDGYVRVRDVSATIDILEMLKEFSWTFYNIAESNSILSSLAGEPDASPPPKGIPLLGFDGTYVRRVKTTSDGKLLAQLG